MAFARKARQIRCPKCDYSGRVKTKGSDIGLWLVFGILLFASFLMWPLIIPVVFLFIWLLSKPSRSVCPQCDYEEKSSS